VKKAKEVFLKFKFLFSRSAFQQSAFQLLPDC